MQLPACEADQGGRAQVVASAIARDDDAYLRGRPALAAGKYHRMATDRYSYLRGSLSVYASDVAAGRFELAGSRFSVDEPRVVGVGDPHVENFGTLRASDGTLGFEVNDFDAADRVPYLWDVRRLAMACAVAATLANQGDAPAQALTFAARRSIARAAACGYRDAVFSFANGNLPARVTDGTGSAVVADLFRRAARDAAARAELASLTTYDGTTRRLKRGSLDPADPENVYAELPDFAHAALPDMLAAYRSTLASPPPPPEALTVLDAVREMGSGVASWPKIRAIVLLRGATDAPTDDVLIEVKELTDSGRSPGAPPYVAYDTVADRILRNKASAWARPDADAYWGVSTWLGLTVQVRAETEASKTIRVSKLTGKLGTVPAVTDLATVLGKLLARIHASDHAALVAVATAMQSDPEGFCDEQADVGSAYADRVLADQSLFRGQVIGLGYSLGVRRTDTDEPHPALAALLGVPPSPPPSSELIP
jgi:uncharacterized protein (DUF2252 family)